MSQTVNKQILVGHIGAAPTAADLPSGSRVLNLSVATNRTWKDKESGDKEQRTDWHNVSIFGKSAENAEQILKSGDYVYIEGETIPSSYEKDGQKHYRTDIHCSDWKILSSRSDSEEDNGNQ
ncbi:MAG: single-stranded DNA-binding protein [Gammaproteobacteria bacterium]|nr:single-stranded DNA-binding protein [Gammaproteobacteria bacterium]MBL4729721.1 single-stranded DNA-binding protein [Gammaproteobacteria bacterium]